MYLSRVELDYTDRKIYKELNHLGAFHNLVEKCFPWEIENNYRTRKLWRIDRLNGKNYLLVLSEEKPDLEILEEYGKKRTAMTKYYDDFLNSLYEGQKVKFRVVLNPIISKSEGHVKNKRGRVFPLIKEEDQMNYLSERDEKNGFKINEDDFYLLKSNFEIIKKKNNKKLKIVKAEYQGQLTIIDKEKFIEVLRRGMGKEKAYGFGMMTVIPM